VTADHVIVACNGYLGDLVPEVAARVMPINNFIVATEPLGDRVPLAEPVAVADSRFVVNYWRMSSDGRLLFGGGESYGWRFPADIAALVRRPMAEVYPQLARVRIDHAWGGTLAITMNRAPCFLRVGRNVLSASGYSGHGVALAGIAGRILAEAVAGQAGRFDVLARLPMPAFPGGTALRWPLLVLAMTWFSLRDRLGL
jgi:gamma-glutamylputrescine oxidase